MSETAKTDTDEKRYLLGDLSEDDAARMEEAFFTDDSKFETVELAEDELIEAYVRNELSPAELQLFKAKLMSSERLKERVHFARALREKVASFVESTADGAIEQAVSRRSAKPRSRIRWWEGFYAQRPALRMALAACLILVPVAGIVLVSRLRSESARIEAERAAVQRRKEDSDNLARDQQARAAQLGAEKRAKDQQPDEQKPLEVSRRTDHLKEPQTRQSALSKFATVILTPGSLRSGDGSQSELILKPETTTARIQLALEKNEYPTYNATIKTADGVAIFRKKGLKPHSMGSFAQLLLSVPAKVMTRGAHTVHVDGVTASGQVEEVMAYIVRVIKR